jgi:uncharacterized protein YgbK (DUF1537 family)
VAVPDFAWYGDDLTGASDTLATLARAGVPALLFFDVPTPARLAAAGPLQAIGVAGTARSKSPDAMREELRPVAAFLAGCGARLLHYKVCSTFDSAPHVGNIAVAVDTLHRADWDPLVTVIGGQPSLGRWCVFGQLFAQAGADGPVFRIDRHPTMSRHPVTPMDEADLAAHLARQGLAPHARIDWRTVEAPGDALARALDAAAAAAEDTADDADNVASRRRIALLDAFREEHLAAIGARLAERARRAPVLVVGASSVAQAMIGERRAAGALPPRDVDGGVAPAEGPVFGLAGSLSPLSARQLREARSFERVALDPTRLVAADGVYLRERAEALARRLRDGRHVLAHVSPLDVPQVPLAADAALAPACGALLREVLARAPVRRVGVAGGDTSSHALRALEPWGLGWLGDLGAGAMVGRLRADASGADGIELMLKGGQMGTDDVFERLLAGTR